MLEGNKTHKMDHFDQATEVLSSIRRISKNDSKRLLYKYGSINDIILADDYNEFLNIEGIGSTKVESLLTCFRGDLDPNANKSKQ